MRELREITPGVWRVVSAELAPQIAHIHANVLKAARAALQDEPTLAVEDIQEARYRTPLRGKIMPCRLMSRVGLIAVFKHLHCVPACRDIRAVLQEYLELFDERVASVQSLLAAPKTSKCLDAFRQGEPAPDSAIAPPDPEPADTLAPVPPWQVSWRITDAIELVEKAGAPQDALRVLKVWNNDRRWDALQSRAQSWGDVASIYNDSPRDEIP